MFLQVKYLSRIQLHIVFDNIVVRDVVAPAFSADFVRGVKRVFGRGVAGGVGGCVVEVGGEGVGREGVVGLGRGGWVVEVDVEEEGMLVARVSLFELSGDGPVRGADVALDDFAYHAVDVGDLGEFPGTPVVEEGCASEQDESGRARFAGVVAVVEGAGVEPDPIYGSSHKIALVRCEETPAFEVVLPLLEWKDVAPFLGCAPMLHNLLEQSERERNGANNVRRLAFVMGEELSQVF